MVTPSYFKAPARGYDFDPTSRPFEAATSQSASKAIQFRNFKLTAKSSI